MTVSDLADALAEMESARRGYAKAKAYARGPIDEVFTSRKLKRLLRNNHITFQTVLGGVVIDAVANKLEITDLAVDNEAAAEALAAVEKQNKMDLLRPFVMRMALVFGDAYLMAWPETDDNGKPTGRIFISYNDPRTVRILYDADNPMVKRLLIKKWATSDKKVRVDLIYEDRVEHFISKRANGRASAATDFEPYAPEGGKEVEENAWGIPGFHFTTTMPGEYGIPEHEPFYGTQDKLNKLTVSHMGGIDFTSIPQRAALLDATTNSSEAASLDEDEFSVSPDGQRTVHKDGDGNSNLSSEPGSLWWLKGVRDLKQFDPASPDAFLKPEIQYLNEGATATSTPLYLFNTAGDFPSGKALRTANAPLDAKAKARKLSFDSTWDEFYRFLMKLLGYPDATVSLTWAPVQTVDEDEKLAQAGVKQELGVPADTTLVELGYDDERVKQWSDDGEGLLPQRIESFARLATALRDISVAVTAGVIDQAVVNELASRLLEDADHDSPEQRAA